MPYGEAGARVLLEYKPARRQALFEVLVYVAFGAWAMSVQGADQAEARFLGVCVLGAALWSMVKLTPWSPRIRATERVLLVKRWPLSERVLPRDWIARFEVVRLGKNETAYARLHADAPHAAKWVTLPKGGFPPAKEIVDSLNAWLARTAKGGQAR